MVFQRSTMICIVDITPRNSIFPQGNAGSNHRRPAACIAIENRLSESRSNGWMSVMAI